MAADAGAPEKTNRTRSRLGCLGCRRRRRKCDGAQPRCLHCRTRGEDCRWGLKASFHPSRAHELSSKDSAALLAIEAERGLAGTRSELLIVNDTDQIVREFRCDQSVVVRTPDEFRDVEDSPGAGPARGNGNLDADAPNNPIEATADHDAGSLTTLLDPVILNTSTPRIVATPLETTPRYDRIGGAQSFEDSSPSSVQYLSSNGDNSSVSTFIPPFSLGQALCFNASPLPELELPVSKAERSQLISAYLQETGTWCETTDSSMHFTMCSIHEMMDNEAFVAAAMALASRQLDAVKQGQRQVTLRLYQHAIRLLIHQDAAKADATVLATCTLLCVYEMMASDVGEWRRHLKGCAGLLRSKNWNGSSHGIINACFWAFARIDVWAAFIVEEETLMPTDTWVDDSAVRSIAEHGTIDAYCNLATLMFAKIVNFIADTRKLPEGLANQTSRINVLWRELQEWRDCRPRKVLPLLRTESLRKSPFQVILYTHPSSICGNTFYHAGSMLLLQTKHVLQNGSGADINKYDPIWHAKELCGISTSNPSHANWVNHLQPLYIAGKAFSHGSATRLGDPSHSAEDEASGEEEYPAEKIALLRHLAKIERETGWKTSGRAAELRSLWGFG